MSWEPIRLNRDLIIRTLRRMSILLSRSGALSWLRRPPSPGAWTAALSRPGAGSGQSGTRSAPRRWSSGRCMTRSAEDGPETTLLKYTVYPVRAWFSFKFNSFIQCKKLPGFRCESPFSLSYCHRPLCWLCLVLSWLSSSVSCLRKPSLDPVMLKHYAG